MSHFWFDLVTSLPVSFVDVGIRDVSVYASNKFTQSYRFRELVRYRSSFIQRFTLSAVATQPNNIVLSIRCLLGDQACEQEQSTKNVKSYSDSRNLQWVKVKRACAVVDPSF